MHGSLSSALDVSFLFRKDIAYAYKSIGTILIHAVMEGSDMITSQRYYSLEGKHHGRSGGVSKW